MSNYRLSSDLFFAAVHAVHPVICWVNGAPMFALPLAILFTRCHSPLFGDGRRLHWARQLWFAALALIGAAGCAWRWSKYFL